MSKVNEPLLTVSIISCNRLHYLRALIESARECLPRESIQWIIVDNASIEDGIQAYLNNLDFVDHVIRRERREPAREWTLAYNQILELAEGRFFLLLTDDVQFIVRGGAWLEHCVEIAETYPRVGSIVLDAQRRSTIDRFFVHRRWKRFLPLPTPSRRYGTSDGRFELRSYGSLKPGISPAVANSLSRTEIWRQLGPVTTRGAQSLQDAGGGFEETILHRYAHSGLKLERCLLQAPVLASIVTDMRGTQARIRGNRRYGNYFSPSSGSFYYKIWDEIELEKRKQIIRALSFEEVVEPLGFDLPLDDKGNLKKNPLQEGAEFEWIHPSVEGIEI